MASLVFTVERKEPELIPPCEPTPHEFKYLSNLDNERSLWQHNSLIQFCRNSETMAGRDPVKIIKEAIAKTLVYYYPVAGRLREGPKGKFVVECTGEGVLFIEGSASVSLEQFGDVPLLPFPCIKELLYDVPGSRGILHCPLFLIQVTRLICGGFIFAFRHNHIIGDATGFLQFMKALGEIACGASFPSVEPVWERQLLSPRGPSSCTHNMGKISFHPTDNKKPESVHRSFFFGLKEIAALKNQFPTDFGTCSKVEIVIAVLWKCHTLALGLDFNKKIALSLVVNARSKFSPPLPVGYYGNAFAKPVAMSTAGELRGNGLGYTIKLIQRAKAEVTDELMRSQIDQLVHTNQGWIDAVPTLHVSDLTKMKFTDVDFGWGKAVYGGPTAAGFFPTFLLSSRNREGDDGIVIIIKLPIETMKMFSTEIEKITRRPTFLMSTL